MMGLELASFQEKWKDYLMESLDYVDGDVVDAVLHGAVLEFGLLLFHLAAVGVGYFRWLEAELAAGFEVDELMGSGVVVELQLMGAVEGVE